MDTNIAFVSKKILKTKAIILPWKDHKRTTSSLFPEMNFWRALEISRVDYILLSNTLVKAKKWVPILSEPVWKIDTFWKSSRNFGHTTKFSTGPSWTPKSPKNQQFLWGPVTKKITQCAGPQKSHKNEFFETFFLNEILLYQNFNFWTKKFRENLVENWHAKDWHISEVVSTHKMCQSLATHCIHISCWET